MIIQRNLNRLICDSARRRMLSVVRVCVKGSSRVGRCEFRYQIWISSKCERSYQLYLTHFKNISWLCLMTSRLSSFSQWKTAEPWKERIKTRRTQKDDFLRKHFIVLSAPLFRIETRHDQSLWQRQPRKVIHHWFKRSSRRFFALWIVL